MQFISLALLSVALVNAQQPGHQKQDAWPGLTVQQCSSSGCEDENSAIVLDSNWDWVHKKGTYTNCYTGNSWDPSFCPDAETCAENCALDAGSVEDYESSYGISTTGSTVQLNFVTQGADSPSANVGSRTYLLDGPTGASGYKMFKLKNREFTFDVDVSKLPCGLNGALYFVEMDQDGGMAKYPGNKAGAAYGTGYCDAQCPHDIKFINGEANLKNWSKSGSTTGTGHYGTCCTEMDIWESNSISQALTPHACSVKGQTRCEGLDCGDGDQRQQGVCDKDGCDFNPYRFGSKTFFGPGSSFQIDTTKPFTVVTQFVTEDGTDTGKLSEIRRVWVQDGKVINNPNVTVGGNSYNSISDEFCADQKKWTGDENTFAKRGGLSAVEGSFERGMVLVMSLWDDHAANMLWLDSDYPLNKSPSAPGVSRGSCSTDSGKPDDVEKNARDAYVKYFNIKYGTIGSTFGPSPSPGPSPGPSPSPAGCPGGSLSACIGLCPSSPAAAYKACVDECVKRC